MQADLIVLPFGKSTENADGDCSDDDRPSEGLEKDGVLNLAKSWLLDPHFTVEDLAEDVTLLVLGNPGFVLIAIGTAHRVERAFAHVEVRRIVVLFSK